MDSFLAIPYELRVAGLFVLEVCAGGLLNLAIYRLAYFPRAISPWSAPPPGTPPRRWSDRLPIVGWLGLRREAPIHGPGHWIRPLVIELGVGLLFAALYDWEIRHRGLLPDVPGLIPPAEAALHVAYFSHLVLMLLMMAASFIDIDEKIIPDAITVPGTLIGLLLAALVPWSLLPIADFQPMLPPTVEFLRLTSPGDWPAWLGGAPRVGSLVLGLACFAMWCFALLPRPWRTRHGWRRALKIVMARMGREAMRPLTLAIELVVAAGIVAAWWRGGAGWEGLLTALVGMAAGGAIVWSVRIVGTAVLHKEAMGFGDVTLLAMIGAYLGWQPCLIVFFLAPFAGLVLGAIQLLLNRGGEIPYGPFLCLAAAVVVVRWRDVWEAAEPIFQLGWYVPLVMLTCLALMALMLGAWRAVVNWARK